MRKQGLLFILDQEFKMEEKSELESFVLHSSNSRISVLAWRMDIEKNWRKLMHQNTKLLVLTGIHGGAKGELELVV